MVTNYSDFTTISPTKFGHIYEFTETLGFGGCKGNRGS